MDGSPVLEVVIGLMLMYLMLSILCTTINEYIATFFGMRANTLRASVSKLIDAPMLLTNFYNHGVVRSAFPRQEKHPSYLSGMTFAMGLLGSLDPNKPLAGFDDVKQAVMQLPHSDIKDVLLATINAADNDLTALRNNLSAWFDNSMDRVSGIYKRKLKVISLLVGILLAVAVNADSVAVANSLWSNAALRQEVTDLASKTVNDASTSCHPGDQGCTLAVAPEAAVAALKQLPIGWNKAVWDATHGWAWAIKIMGIMVSGLALALGAPFWFDLLAKFMNIRGNGEKPERTTTPATGSAAQ